MLWGAAILGILLQDNATVKNWLADDVIPGAFVACPVAIATLLTNAHGMIMFSAKIPLCIAFFEKHYVSLGRSKQKLFHSKKKE